VSQVEAAEQTEYAINGDVIQVPTMLAQNLLYIIGGKWFLGLFEHLEHQLPRLSCLISLGLQSSNRILDHGSILAD
jgi:hypothetical protein